MKRCLSAAVCTAALLFTLVTPSAAQFTVFDPSNFVKNTLTELHTLQITINQATQTANQLRQIAYELQNLRSIPNGVWGQARGDLASLKQVTKVGQNISYADANLANEFTQMYPGYTVPTNYEQSYRQWGSNSLGGIQGALAAAGLQSDQLDDEDGVLAVLESLSDGAVGHMQAIQAGNMIAAQVVQQLQKLRQLQMAQMQGEFGYLASGQQNDLAKHAMLKAWLDSQERYWSSE
jgi:P-type conjugative transfer protein TrbJ